MQSQSLPPGSTGNEDGASTDIDKALKEASRRWAALPEVPDKPGRYNQPYMKYDEFAVKYKANGGTSK